MMVTIYFVFYTFSAPVVFFINHFFLKKTASYLLINTLLIRLITRVLINLISTPLIS